MKGWIWHGLRRGILTTRYPRISERMPERYRGMVVALDAGLDEQQRGALLCPTQAITTGPTRANVDLLRCVQCGLCAQAAPKAFVMNAAFELASYADADAAAIRSRLRDIGKTLGRSVHIRHVDAGSDGSEEQELQAIFNPFYDANRLGIFLTATPRHADILIVSGALTETMREPLRRAYDAMPKPCIVIALGSTACSGAVFSGSGTLNNGIEHAIPVDVRIPGSPPSPLTILNGLLLALGRMEARTEAPA